LRRFLQQRTRLNANRRKGFRRVDQVHGLRQRADGIHIDAFDDGSFARIGFRHDYSLDLVLARRERRRERSADRTHLAVER